MIIDEDAGLEHHGVRGMRWGSRNKGVKVRGGTKRVRGMKRAMPKLRPQHSKVKLQFGGLNHIQNGQYFMGTPTASTILKTPMNTIASPPTVGLGAGYVANKFQQFSPTAKMV